MLLSYFFFILLNFFYLNENYNFFLDTHIFTKPIPFILTHYVSDSNNRGLISIIKTDNYDTSFTREYLVAIENKGLDYIQPYT